MVQLRFGSGGTVSIRPVRMREEVWTWTKPASCGSPRVQVRETLESIHESAHAHSDVRSTTAELELAYIVAKHHNGQLTFSLNDLMNWSQQDEQDTRRSRSEEAIMIWIDKLE